MLWQETHKHNLINWSLDKLEDQPYYLDSISKCHKENGLRYLFELTNHPPTKSFMDPNFAWLYQKPPSDQVPNLTLLVTDKTLNTENLLQNNQSVIDSATFGAMDAYIIKSN